MTKVRIVTVGVPRVAGSQPSLEARKQVLVDLIRAEVSESTRRVRAFWHDYADGWEVEFKETGDRHAKRRWWRFW